MDVWQLIKRDHANIEQLIHETPNALNGPGVVRSRERLLGDLMDELETHASALEASLYAPLSRQDTTRQLIEDLRRERAEFMKQLGGLAQYRRRGSAGWLDRFEDATSLVDQHLHRHKLELIPAARELLGPEEVEEATHAFVRAKMQALQSRRPGLMGRLASSELALTTTVCAAVAVLGLIAWRFGLLKNVKVPLPRSRENRNITEGQPRSDLAAASAPDNRVPGEDLRERQEQLLDEAIEETFPASDPISPKRITK